MKSWPTIFCSFIGMIGILPDPLFANSISLVNDRGETLELQVSEQDRFIDVIDGIRGFFDTKGSEVRGATRAHFDLAFSNVGLFIRAKTLPVERKYENGINKQEKKEITYIINTLVKNSTAKVALHTLSLNEAGDRIKHLHPFWFLACIFTDEKLKCGAHAIKEKGGLIKKSFYSGITTSLQEEHQNDNLLQYVSAFASEVKIDLAIILPSLQEGKWEEFVNLLITHIPRKNDPTRYDL